MRTYRAHFVTMAPHAGVIPSPTMQEIAMVGRSNSGKSTLINFVVGQRHLARVSQRPGKTRAIVFFDVEERFHLVDLPGYGFAKTSQKEQAQWERLLLAYLDPKSRPLVGVLALFDMRRDPDELDMAMVEMLRNAGIAWRAVWTKADKLKPSQRKNRVRKLNELLGTEEPGLMVSSQAKLGRDDIWSWVDERLGPEVPA